MDDFFDTPARKWFFGLFLLVSFAALLLIRFLLFPWLLSTGGPILDIKVAIDISKSIVDSAIAAIATTSTVTLVILAFLPSKKLSSAIELVPPAETNFVHEQALKTTSHWIHLGHYGKWVRSCALPILAEAAQASRERTVTFIIPDPNNERLLDSVANFKSGGRAAIQEGSWSADRVRSEILASVFAAYWWNLRPMPIQVTVVVTQHFRRLRVDVNSEWVVVTSDYPRDSALFARANTHYYDLFVEEVRCERDQGRLLLDRSKCHLINKSVEYKGDIQAEYVMKVFEELSIKTDIGMCNWILENFRREHVKYK